MAKITIEEIYSGEKYDVFGSVVAEYMTHGRPKDYDRQTWVDMLIVKHSIIAAEKMREEGDSVSSIIDTESSSSYVRWDENDNT